MKAKSKSKKATKKASPAKRKAARKEYEKVAKKAKPGSGARSKAMKKSLLSEGMSPKEAGAIIGIKGREKYGKRKMASWSAKGRKKK